jgi:AraC-like DNA-binding protein
LRPAADGTRTGCLIRPGMEVNFNSFMKKYRIDEAKALLSGNVNLSILQTAYSVGFNSKSAFNAAFQKFTGTTLQ